MKNVQKLYASLLDKTKPYAEELTPALLKNLVLVGCLILVKETVNLNKLKNHVGILLDNAHTQTDSNYRRLTRFFHLPIDHFSDWLLSRLGCQLRVYKRLFFFQTHLNVQYCVRPPILLLAFANDQDDHLANLEAEQENVQASLYPLQAEGRFIIDNRIRTSDGLRQVLINYNDQVSLLHFGGHAGSSRLVFPDNPAPASAIATLLGIQHNLGLVFLNGCRTIDQVDLLLEKGVPAVIATSVLVGDSRACAFASAFYEKLTSRGNEGTLYEAFEAAIGSLEMNNVDLQRTENSTRYGMTLRLDPIEDETPLLEWGLYFRKEREAEVLNWRLPNQVHEEARTYSNLVKKEQSKGGAGYNHNDKLAQTLYLVLLPYLWSNTHIDENGTSTDYSIREVQFQIVNALPYPIGKQIIELFAIDENAEESLGQQTILRLEKLIDTFDILVELLAYVMMAQLWDAISNTRAKGEELDITESCRFKLFEYFNLSPKEMRRRDLLSLVREIRVVLERNSIPFFIEELAELKETIDNDTEFMEAYAFLQSMKVARVDNTLKANLCEITENNLCILFKRLGFCAKYNLASIKHIQVNKSRNNKASFNHQSVRLKYPYIEWKDERRVFDNFTDSNSVILLKGKDYGPVTYLNLSPFIIDEMGLKGLNMSKIYFFESYNRNTRRYYYKNIDNMIFTADPIQNPINMLVVGPNDYSEVKALFDEFVSYFRPQLV